jgi:Ubiquitin carboxyl-terminal hydrolase
LISTYDVCHSDEDENQTPPDPSGFSDNGSDSSAFAAAFSLFDDEDERDSDSSVHLTSTASATGCRPAFGPANKPDEHAAGPASTAPTSTVERRSTTSFISSMLGGFGFGTVAAAPYGYGSVVASLESFTEIERLEGDNAYGCDECTRREGLRQARSRPSATAPATTDEPSTSAAAAHYSRRARSTVSLEDEPDACENGSTSPVLNRQTLLCEEMPTEDRTSSESHGFSRKIAQFVTSSPHELRDPTSGILLSAADTYASSSNGSGPAGTGGDGSGNVATVGAGVLISSPVTSSESSCGAPSEAGSTSCSRSEGGSERDDDETLRAAILKIPTVRSPAEKSLMIQEAPRALIIHMKRFTQVGLRGQLRKISGHVEFPLLLDLAPFVDAPAPAKSGSEGATKSGKHAACVSSGRGRKKDGTVSSLAEAASDYMYRLSGVVVHSGSLNGGHYTSQVREGVENGFRGGWFNCSDSRVTRSSEKDVLASEAFMLFYERVRV